MLLRDAVKVVQFNLRAFFSVRTWPWMMLFYKLRPMLRSAQVEKELTALNENFTKLKDAFGRFVSTKRSQFSTRPSSILLHLPSRCDVKRQEAEDRQVVLIQEKNDLALQLQAVSHADVGSWLSLGGFGLSSLGAVESSAQDKTCAPSV